MPDGFFVALADLFRQHPVAQAIGFAAMLIGSLSYHCRTARRILLVQCAASVFWSAHFVMLGATTGAFLNVFVIPRNVIYAQRGGAASDAEGTGDGPKTWADWLVWPVFFAALYVAGLFFARFVAGESWICLLSVVAQVGATFALRSRSAQFIRLASIAISLLWLVYDAISGSVPGVVCEVMNQLSIYTALFRYRRRTA